MPLFDPSEINIVFNPCTPEQLRANDNAAKILFEKLNDSVDDVISAGNVRALVDARFIGFDALSNLATINNVTSLPTTFSPVLAHSSGNAIVIDASPAHRTWKLTAQFDFYGTTLLGGVSMTGRYLINSVPTATGFGIFLSNGSIGAADFSHREFDQRILLLDAGDEIEIQLAIVTPVISFSAIVFLEPLSNP